MKAVKTAYTTLIKSLVIAGSLEVSLHTGVNFVAVLKNLPIAGSLD
jgi:hypothetical protein